MRKTVCLEFHSLCIKMGRKLITFILILFAILSNVSAQNCLIGDEDEDGDWGNGFENAEIIEAACLPFGETFTIEGRVDEDDVDVFKLDMSFSSGDNLYAQMSSETGAIGLFYPGEESLMVDEESNLVYGRAGINVDLNFMESYPYLYLVTATSPFVNEFSEYRLSISRSSGNIPEPNPDVIFLDFDGAENVGFGGRPPIDIPPLEESWLADEYPDNLEEIKDIIT